MSFRDCVLDAKNEGVVNDEQYQYIINKYNDYELFHKTKLGEAQASLQAAKDTQDALKFEAALKRRNRLLQLKTSEENWTRIYDFDGGNNLGDGLRSLASPDSQGRNSKWNLEYQSDSISKQAFSEMAELLVTYGKKGVFGSRMPVESMKDVVFEAFGEATNNGQAKVFAQSWKTTSDLLFNLRNKYGGATQYLKNWGLPQTHNNLKIRQASSQEWSEFISARLDKSKMISERTGLPFTDKEFDQLIKDQYENIRTEGWSTREPSSNPFTTSLANKEREHRFFVFKDAEAWWEYNQKFGDADPYMSMINHVENMARDIALFKVFGPNPRASIELLKQRIRKEAALNNGMEGLDARFQAFDEEYHTFSGGSNVVSNQLVAVVGDTARSMASAIFLGRAIFSALGGDLHTQIFTAKYVGMPPSKVLTRILKDSVLSLGNLGMDQRRIEYTKMGLVAENSIRLGVAQARFVGQLMGPTWAQVVPDTVLRASGLSPYTQIGRHAFGVEFFSWIASNAKNTLEELPVDLRTTLTQFGLDKDWDKLRASQLYKYGSSETYILRPNEIRLAKHIDPNEAEDLATRYLAMTLNLQNKAVLTQSLRERAAIIGTSEKGSPRGELLRASTLFKHFAITLFYEHIIKILKDQHMNHKWFGVDLPPAASRALWITTFAGSATLFGAVATQMKEISKGRDPLPMNTKKFWMTAAAQGGGLGILGDFIYGSMEGYKTELLGPIGDFTRDTANLTFGNAFELASGKDTKVVKEALRYAQRYTPGQSLWWGGLAFNRVFLEQLAMMADPKLKTRLREEEKKLRTKTDQKFWWRPGKMSPSRAPDISKESLTTNKE